MRGLALALLLALGLLAAGCGDDDSNGATEGADTTAPPAETEAGSTAAAAATALVGGRDTTIAFSDEFAEALSDAGVELEAVDGAELDGTNVTFPVTGGRIAPDDLSGTVEHTGALRLTAGERSTELRSPFLDTRTGTLYTRMNGSTVATFLVERGDVAIDRDGDTITAEGFGLTLAPDGASALSDSLDTPLEAGTSVGQADLALDTNTSGIEGLVEGLSGEAAEIEQRARELSEAGSEALSEEERKRLEDAANELESVLEGL